MSGVENGYDGGGAEAASGSANASVVDAGVAPDQAVLSVVSGQPSDEELAALTAVVIALQGQDEADDVPTHGRSWARRALLRLGPTPGPGSWRRSVR